MGDTKPLEGMHGGHETIRGHTRIAPPAEQPGLAWRRPLDALPEGLRLGLGPLDALPEVSGYVGWG